MQIVEFIRLAVKENSLKEACDIVISSNYRDEGIALISQLKDLEKQSIFGTILPSERDLLLNRIRFSLLQLATSIEEAAKEIRQSSEAVSNLLGQGEILFYQKKYSEALKLYQSVLDTTPDNIEAKIKISIIYCETGEYEKSIRSNFKILETNPSFDRVLNNLGVVYEKMNSFQLALEKYTEAFNINPLEEIYVNNKVNILRRMNRWNEIIEFYSLAIRANPSSSSLYMQRGKVFADKMNDYQSALKDVNYGISLNPSNPEYHFERGLIYAKQGNVEIALQNFNYCISVAPRNEYFKKSKAAVLMDNKHWRVALDDIQALRQLNPNSPDLLLMEGVCLYWLNYIDSAFKSLSKCLYLKPNECEALHFIGHIYRLKGNKAYAIYYYKRRKICYENKSIS